MLKRNVHTKNAIWVQSVLETIFDEEYISTKVKLDIVEIWIETLMDEEQQVTEYCIYILFSNLFVC